MAPKRAKPAAVVEPLSGDDSDDDAPEEFSHAQARDQALQQRKDEKQTAAGQRRAEAEKRRSRAQASQAAAAATKATAAAAAAGADADGDADADGSGADGEDEEEGAGLGPGSSGGEDEEDEEGADGLSDGEAGDSDMDGGDGDVGVGGDDDGADLLPDSVLAAVAAAEERRAVATAEAGVAEMSRRAAKRAAKRARTLVVKQSLVKVAVLPKVKAAAAAGNYVKEALYGDRIRRSAEMLTKNKRGPAAKFVR